MLTADTKRHIDAARQVLVGKVPNPISQIQEITNALVYKFMDDMDEKAASMGGKRRYFTGEYTKFSWRAIMDPKIGAHERIGLYTEALSRLSKNPNLPELFRNIFRNAYLPFNDGRVLTLFLKEIDYFDYSKSQELGDAYEYLLSIMGSQGDAGQFRTPRHIIDFMVAVINPTKNDSVLDPACGTAGFLISAYKHVMAQHDGVDEEGKSITTEKPLTADEKKHLHAQYKGFDIDDSMVKMAQVNLYLHGFPDPKIMVHDTLSSQDYWQDRYDVILANPPFMSPKGGSLPHNKFGIKSTRSEVLFVDYITSHLKPHGRAAIIVPEGIIFQSGKAHKELRQHLVNDGLYAVVSLPSGVFNPYAGVKTSILLFDNSRAKETDELLFVKINNDGYDLGATKRKIAQNDLPEAEQILNLWKQGKKSDSPLALYVPKSKIAEGGDYNLSGDRYRVTTDYSNAKWPMVELGNLEKDKKLEFLRGQGLSKNDITMNGRSKCIHYGEIYTLYDTVIKNVLSKTDIDGKVRSEKGDVLVPATTTADALGIAVARSINENDVIIGGDINIVRTANKFILSDYLAYLICHPPLKIELSTFAKGANILHLSNNDIRKLKIPLPPPKVQQQLVDELDGYAAIIAGAKQVVSNWKPKIDIDPEWEKVKLGQIGRVRMCKRIFKDQTNSKSGVPFFKIGTFGGKPDAYISPELFSDFKSKFSYPKKGEVLISTSGTIGKIVVFDGEPAYFQDSNIVWIENDERVVFNAYLEQIFQSLSWVTTKGGTIARLYNKLIEETEILVPPLSRQKQIVAKIEAERALVDSAKQLIEIYEQKTKEAVSKLWSEKS